MRPHLTRASVLTLMAVLVIVPLAAAQTAITWEKDLKAGLDKAKAANKPILLDFYNPL